MELALYRNVVQKMKQKSHLPMKEQHIIISGLQLNRNTDENLSRIRSAGYKVEYLSVPKDTHERTLTIKVSV